MWDSRFIALAKHIARWSKDPSTQCGAVIVDVDKRIISTGYNGLPRGVEDTPERLEVRDTKYGLVIHAEENALLYARQSLGGCTIYVWPMPPCSRCAAKIIQSGITRVVSVPVLSREVHLRWSKDWLLANQMYVETNTQLHFVKGASPRRKK